MRVECVTVILKIQVFSDVLSLDEWFLVLELLVPSASGVGQLFTRRVARKWSLCHILIRQVCCLSIHFTAVVLTSHEWFQQIAVESASPTLLL